MTKKGSPRKPGGYQEDHREKSSALRSFRAIYELLGSALICTWMDLTLTYMDTENWTTGLATFQILDRMLGGTYIGQSWMGLQRHTRITTLWCLVGTCNLNHCVNCLLNQNIKILCRMYLDLHNMVFKMSRIQSKSIKHIKNQEDHDSFGERQSRGAKTKMKLLLE